MRQCETEGHAHVNAPRFRQGGPGAKKSPRWSAERRASPGCANCVSWFARGREGERSRPAGLRHWPADGCRCTRAPVGAPLPRGCEGKTANLGEQMPRENDDACAPSTRQPEVPERSDIRGRCIDANGDPGFRHSASIRTFTPVFDGLWTRVNALTRTPCVPSQTTSRSPRIRGRSPLGAPPRRFFGPEPALARPSGVAHERCPSVSHWRIHASRS